MVTTQDLFTFWFTCALLHFIMYMKFINMLYDNGIYITTNIKKHTENKKNEHLKESYRSQLQHILIQNIFT